MPDDQDQNTDEGTQDTSDDSQDTGQDQGTLDNDQSDSDDGPKFTKAQMQQMSSMMGSIVQRQVTEAIENQVKPLMGNTQPDKEPSSVSDTSNPAYNQFNEQLFERFMGGDVMGALNDYQNVTKTADKNLSVKKQTALEKAMTAHSKDPDYKDIYPNLLEEASTLMKEGYPPAAAADTAFTRAKLRHLEGKSNTDEGDLDLATGGKHNMPAKTTKLPPEMEAAYQRDKEMFKDRGEYIENLSPQIRAIHGL
jgi:hypothetical protein